MGGLAYIGAEKAFRATEQLRSALAGTMIVAEYVRLVGLLNHLVVLQGLAYHCMYGVYDALDAARAEDTVAMMHQPGG